MSRSRPQKARRAPSRRGSRPRRRQGPTSGAAARRPPVLARLLLLLALGAILFATGVLVGSRLGGRSEAEPPAAFDEARQPSKAAEGTAVSTPTPATALDQRRRIALVIDDLGRSLEVLDRLRGLAVPLTYSVLPFEPQSGEVARILADRGAEILCHLPMEAQGGADPGPGALLATMSSVQLRASTELALAAVPGARGVNNHMGSVLSTRPAAMRPVLELLRERQLFFLDSRTSPRSVGYRLALQLGVGAAERQVFLDGDPSPVAIRRQFERLLARAQADGSAIAIGHPHAATIETLEREVPAAVAQGFSFVTVSELIEVGAAAASGAR